MQYYVVLAALALGLAVFAGVAQAEDKADKHLGHMVYFKLKDPSDANKQKLVEACKKYLTDHPGTVYFSAGTVAPEFTREVNDREWDVALHLVFKDKASHDKYQDDPRHVKFVDDNKAGWAKVRVFDSWVSGPVKK